MDELQAITDKYSPDYIGNQLESLPSLNRFALSFYKDVSEIYDCLTRVRNIERNPSGFGLQDAPILGLLVRIAKLLKEILVYYERNNAEIISILERPLLESSIIATYLLRSTPEVITDYRKCSYKDRLRVLRNFESGSSFISTRPGQRLLRSVREKMQFEGLTPQDFTEQRRNRWKIQGKTFYEIFGEVENAEFYAPSYGMMSESIHGSWNDSMDWCLARNSDGTFSAFLLSYPADIRFVTPTLRFTNTPFRLWLERIDAYDVNLQNVLDWIERINGVLFAKFDALFD
jgi:hypothetical protein